MLKHVTECDLLTEKQWAYRKGHSTKLLLVHLTESWRHAVDNNLVVATAFIDFRKAFDCVSHRTLLHKLKIKFGIEGNLLSWLTDYLHHRTQVTVVNSTQSEELSVTYVWHPTRIGTRPVFVQFIHQRHAGGCDIRQSLPVCFLLSPVDFVDFKRRN